MGIRTKEIVFAYDDEFGSNGRIFLTVDANGEPIYVPKNSTIGKLINIDQLDYTCPVLPIYDPDTNTLNVSIQNIGKSTGIGNPGGDILHCLYYKGHGDHKQKIRMDYTDDNGTQLCVPVVGGVDVTEALEDTTPEYSLGVHKKAFFGNFALYPPGAAPYIHRLKFNALTQIEGVIAAGLKPGNYELEINQQGGSEEVARLKANNIFNFTVSGAAQGFDLTFEQEPSYDVANNVISFTCGSTNPCDPLQSSVNFANLGAGQNVSLRFFGRAKNENGGTDNALMTNDTAEYGETNTFAVNFVPASFPEPEFTQVVIEASKFGVSSQNVFKIIPENPELMVPGSEHEIEFIWDKRLAIDFDTPGNYGYAKFKGPSYDGDVTYDSTVALKLKFTVPYPPGRKGIRARMENERQQRTTP